MPTSREGRAELVQTARIARPPHPRSCPRTRGGNRPTRLVGGEPLRARWDGKRLTVDLAKIEPKAEANFTIDGKTVTGCRALKEAGAGRLSNIATRH